MTPFLRLIAREYASRHTADELSRFCFVFPNKRSATFFQRYLDLEMHTPHIEPEAVTIADFLETMSPYAEAPRFMQLATLYDVYRSIAPESVTDFDRFIYWGEILLSDFNDVDRYLANPSELFTNVEELREINSTYLTDLQRDIIRRYWGDDAPGLYRELHGDDDEVERFWTHTGDGSTRNAGKFVSLWMILDELYHKFHHELESEGYATSGRIFRYAAQKLKEKGVDAIPHRADQYIFVGFNMLSTAEIAVFEELKKAKIADFYWDTASPLFHLDGNKSGRTALNAASMFPSRFEIEEKPLESPEIEVIGVASAVGQAKIASEYLERMNLNDIDTAVVLADEAMLLPVISHLPESIGKPNITMGFPMKNTPVASVMHATVALQRRLRNVGGRPSFFYEDVMALLAQPVVRSVAPESADKLMRDIREKRLFTLDAQLIAEEHPALAPLFRPIAHNEEGSLDVAVDYFTNLIDLFSRYADETSRPIERRFLMAYRAALDELASAFRSRNITMRETTMAALIERALASATANLTGRPLQGLQVMGVLETRALDFSNLIVMSMNENIYPQRASRPSFVPEALRHAFGLPGKELIESVYGYYFFRLISRAKRVTLLYDARTVGTEKVGEMSRFITQLLYLYPSAKVSHLSAVFPKLPSELWPQLTIVKTPEVMARLKEYMRPGSGKNLSASTLNMYISCPMEFYLQAVEGLNFASETDGEDYIDWSTYGQIFHEVAERLYRSLAARSDNSIIKRETLLAAANNRVAIDRLVTAAVNRNYLRLCKKDEPDRLDPLRGEAKVLGSIVVELISRMLKTEADRFGDFEYKASEEPLNAQIKLSPDLPPINVRQVIDRIDFAGPGGTMRFVDYKTGRDEIDFNSIAEAFEDSVSKGAGKRHKVLFQLMFYCFCYARINHYTGPIQPFIYKTVDLFTSQLPPSTLGKQPLDDYRPYAEEFASRLADLVNSIFDESIPFEARVNDPDYDGHNCKFCRFKAICNPPESS